MTEISSRPTIMGWTLKCLARCVALAISQSAPSTNKTTPMINKQIIHGNFTLNNERIAVRTSMQTKNNKMPLKRLFFFFSINALSIKLVGSL